MQFAYWIRDSCETAAEPNVYRGVLTNIGEVSSDTVLMSADIALVSANTRSLSVAIGVVLSAIRPGPAAIETVLTVIVRVL